MNRWIFHITPASSIPDYSHISHSPGDYTDMLIPFRTYVIDEE